MDKSDRRSLARDFVFRFLFQIDQKENDLNREDLKDEKRLEEAILEFNEIISLEDNENSPVRIDQVDEKLVNLLINNYLKNYDKYTKVISEHLKNKDLSKVKSVDRILLRMGCCELRSIPETPFKVCISEYVQLGNKYGSKESSHLINALLDKLK